MRDGDRKNTSRPHPQTLSDLFGLTTQWPFIRSSDKIKSVFYQAVTESLLKRDVALKEMDVYSLFDKVLLHELTHTRPGRKTVDVRAPPPSFLK